MLLSLLLPAHTRAGHVHVSNDTSYLLWVYRYTSQFNDKRQRWVPAWWGSCQAFYPENRIHVLPSFNVRVANGKHLGNEFAATFQFEPFEHFFDTEPLQDDCRFLSLSDFVRISNGKMDVVVMDPRLTATMFGHACQHNQVVKLSSHKEFPAYNETLGASRILCWANADGAELKEAIRPYRTVLIWGFDSHNDNGASFRYRSSPKPVQLRFAPHVVEEARRFIHEELHEEPFLAIHWRYNGGSHTFDELTFASRLREWLLHLANETNYSEERVIPRALLLISDNFDELSQAYTYSLIRSDGDDKMDAVSRTFLSLPRVRYTPKNGSIFKEPGLLAVTEQSVASQATQFLGTMRSTFTEAIRDERHQNGKSPPFALEELGKKGSSPLRLRRPPLRATQDHKSETNILNVGDSDQNQKEVLKQTQTRTVHFEDDVNPQDRKYNMQLLLVVLGT